MFHYSFVDLRGRTEFFDVDNRYLSLLCYFYLSIDYLFL